MSMGFAPLRRFACVVLSLSVVAAVHAEVKLDAFPDVKSGVYEPGAKVTWTVKAAPKSDPVSGKLAWVIKRGGLKVIAEGEAEFENGEAKISGTRADAGTLLLQVKHRPEGADKDATVKGGAVFAPSKIKASAPVPDDFDAFWTAKIKELDAVPMDVKLEPIDVGDDSIEYFKITMNHIRGRKIYGQIAKPKGKSNLPALLQVQWAGVYPLHRDWVIGHARGGWLSMNIIAHDLPIDEPADFYKQKSANELKDYPGIGADDRETSYFLPMFLSCRRAVDYLIGREDWNKKTLVVRGGSAGH